MTTPIFFLSFDPYLIVISANLINERSEWLTSTTGCGVDDTKWLIWNIIIHGLLINALIEINCSR